MRKKLLLLITVLAVLLSACGLPFFGNSSAPAETTPAETTTTQTTIPEPQDFPVTVRGVKIAAEPERVVSLSPALTEIIFDMGYGDRLVGVDSFSDWPRGAASLTRCGTLLNPELDTIKMLKPSLVLASGKPTEADMILIQQMNADVIVLPHAQTLEELRELYIDLALIFEGQFAGEKGSDTYDDFLEPVAEYAKAIANSYEDKLIVGYVVIPEYTIATGDTFENELFELMGFVNDAKDFTGWLYPKDNWLKFEPHVLLVADEIDQEALFKLYTYYTLKSYKNKKVYTVTQKAFERQGKRMFEEALDIMREYYPDAKLPEETTAPPETQADTETEATSSEASQAAS